MGQARQRGTFEQRKAEAVERQKNEYAKRVEESRKRKPVDVRIAGSSQHQVVLGMIQALGLLGSMPTTSERKI